MKEMENFIIFRNMLASDPIRSREKCEMQFSNELIWNDKEKSDLSERKMCGTYYFIYIRAQSWHIIFELACIRQFNGSQHHDTRTNIYIGNMWIVNVCNKFKWDHLRNVVRSPLSRIFPFFFCNNVLVLSVTYRRWQALGQHKHYLYMDSSYFVHIFFWLFIINSSGSVLRLL